MDSLSGPDPHPRLLHGDAQQHNFVSTDTGAAIIDPAPYFGHPEMDLAQIDVYNPVPGAVFDAYREVAPIDSGFDERRELWCLWCYLAVATVEQSTPCWSKNVLSPFRCREPVPVTALSPRF